MSKAQNMPGGTSVQGALVGVLVFVCEMSWDELSHEERQYVLYCLESGHRVFARLQKQSYQFMELTLHGGGTVVATPAVQPDLQEQQRRLEDSTPFSTLYDVPN